jgi:hypothetical protein
MDITSWQDLLKYGYDGEARDELGPKSDELLSAMDALAEIKWFSCVGAELSSDVHAVSSWDDALSIFSGTDARYGPNGHLDGPIERICRIGDSSEFGQSWQTACWQAGRRTNYQPWFPDWMTTGQADQLDLYLHEFVTSLVAEIVLADTVGMTYFREQLQWFYAGHFPCGWEGEWPVGMMRVF